MPVVASVNEFVAAMRRCDLPGRGGWDELARAAPDVEHFARELARAGFLTNYQSRQLLAGRGDDLVVGPFLVLDQVGAGGMGQVFRARHRLMGRDVALKVMLPALGEDPDVVARFRQEVQAVAKLSHPNIVTAYHADSGPRGLILAMEFCDGRDLGRLVREGGPLAVARACDCAAQTAAGLSAAHAAGLVHRDIKPSNLLLTADGVVKVLDFGLARVFEADDTDRLTHTGASMGTPDFMAPEQARDSAAVDIRGDIYALGCTLYFLLAGRVPFPGGTAWYKIGRHQNDEPEALELLRPQVPAELAAVVRRMTAKDPAARFQTPGEVVAALAPFHSSAPPTVVSPAALPVTHAVIPRGAELPRVVGEAASATVQVAAREPSPFDFADTPAPASDPSTATRLAADDPTLLPAGPRRRALWALWPLWGGAAVGLALAVGAVALLLPRGRSPDTGAMSPAPPTPGTSTKGAGLSKDKTADKADKATAPQRYRVPGSPLPTVNGDTGMMSATLTWRLAFRPGDADVVAVARGQYWNPAFGGVELWSRKAEARQKVQIGGDNHPPVYAVAFSPDGRFFAYGAGALDTSCTDAGVAVYDAQTWQYRGQFATKSHGVLGLSFSPDGQKLVVGTHTELGPDKYKGGLEIWNGGGDWRTPQPVVGPVEQLGGGVMSVAVRPSPEGGFVFATAGQDRTVGAWLPHTQGVGRLNDAGKFKTADTDAPFIDVAWSSNGLWLAAVTNRGAVAPTDRVRHRLAVWHGAGNPAGATPRFAEHYTHLATVAFLPGERVVTGDESGNIDVWRLDNELTSRRYSKSPFNSGVFGLSVSGDGQVLAAAGRYADGNGYGVVFIPVADLTK